MGFYYLFLYFLWDGFSAYIEHLYMLTYAALFSITYLIGIMWFDDPVKVWQRPFKLMGLMGCLGVSFC